MKYYGKLQKFSTTPGFTPCIYPVPPVLTEKHLDSERVDVGVTKNHYQNFYLKKCHKSQKIAGLETLFRRRIETFLKII